MARPRTFDPDRVLDEAVEVFSEAGFDGTSVPALVERLGICRQSLYAEFGDKRGLYLRAVERYGTSQMDAKIRLLQAEGPPLDHLKTVLRGHASIATGCPGNGCLAARAIMEIQNDPEALAIVDAQVERFEAAVRDNLARAQAAGTVRADARPARLARTIVTTIYGMGVLSRLPGSGPRVADAVATLLDLVASVEVR